MSFHRTIIRLSAVLASLALGWACGGDGATAPEPARPTTVTVSPATHELTALGTTVQLSAEVRDQNARVMAGATVTWTSSANSVATVDASGSSLQWRAMGRRRSRRVSGRCQAPRW